MAGYNIKDNIKYKILYFVVLFLFIFSIYAYNQMFHATTYSTQDFLNDPTIAKNETKTIMGTYVESFGNGFYLKYNHKIVPIYTSEKHVPPRYGEMVVKGVFHADGTITAISIHNYNYNYLLYLFSAFAGFFVLLVFFFEWKITRKGLREKNKIESEGCG